jgi:hypothetical protein
MVGICASFEPDGAKNELGCSGLSPKVNFVFQNDSVLFNCMSNRRSIEEDHLSNPSVAVMFPPHVISRSLYYTREAR